MKSQKESCFNSILVRLKESSPRCAVQRPYRFQFHTGSIKRLYQFTVPSFVTSFNSILVRLKGVAPATSNRYLLRFQFHTGSIKSQRWWKITSLSNMGFNSILVRLKASLNAKTPQPFISFNSILVRLKVRMANPFLFALMPVSIPYWFD